MNPDATFLSFFPVINRYQSALAAIEQYHIWEALHTPTILRPDLELVPFSKHMIALFYFSVFKCPLK